MALVELPTREFVTLAVGGTVLAGTSHPSCSKRFTQSPFRRNGTGRFSHPDTLEPITLELHYRDVEAAASYQANEASSTFGQTPRRARPKEVELYEP